MPQQLIYLYIKTILIIICVYIISLTESISTTSARKKQILYGLETDIFSCTINFG